MASPCRASSRVPPSGPSLALHVPAAPHPTAPPPTPPRHRPRPRSLCSEPCSSPSPMGSPARIRPREILVRSRQRALAVPQQRSRSGHRSPRPPHRAVALPAPRETLTAQDCRTGRSSKSRRPSRPARVALDTPARAPRGFEPVRLYASLSSSPLGRLVVRRALGLACRGRGSRCAGYRSSQRPMWSPLGSTPVASPGRAVTRCASTSRALNVRPLLRSGHVSDRAAERRSGLKMSCCGVLPSMRLTRRTIPRDTRVVDAVLRRPRAPTARSAHP